MTEEFRCGAVALIGRPNAGKSTLLNKLLGGKLAITSRKPQTTRDRIVGVRTDEHAQLVLMDTPGLHDAWTELNKAMVKQATDALANVDVVCWVEDVTVLSREEGKPVELDAAATAIVGILAEAGRPVVFVPNKLDRIDARLVLPVIDLVRGQVDLRAAVPTSARSGEGVDELARVLGGLVPVGPAHFPADHWTDATERFLAGETIREKVFELTEQEIPYATAVEIEEFDESVREERGLVRLRAAVIVERSTQKGIVIGKGGAMIKKIGVAARKDLEKLLDCQVHLELFVKVEPDWTRTEKGLRRVGYGGKA